MKCIIWNLASVQLEILLVSVQDSCMVCAQCTIGSEIGSVCLEIVLILMQDRCMVCMEYTICSEINLDTPDGTVDAPDGTTR